MKNFSKYFLMGTVALSGMTAFTACSSENEPSAEVNPTFNGSTVKAQFALNLPYAATGTRMTENATQQNSYFRGMSSMTLLPFAETTVDGEKTSTSAMLLGTNNNAFDKDGAGQGRYVYRDIEIPVGTQNFVFYGKATGTPANTEHADECFKYGYLTEKKSISLNDKVLLSDVKFALKQINSNLNLETATETGVEPYNKVLAALDKVTGTKVGDIAWNNIGTTATDMKLDHAKKLWSAFSDLKAGSSASVKVALERLAESTGVEADGAPATVDGAGLLALLHKNADEAAASLDGLNFPNVINIPDGAVALKYTGSEWKYQSSVTMKEENKIAYANITYPASLNYFVKTAAMANNEAATTLSPTGTFWPKQDEWAKYDAENSATDPWTSLSGWSQGVKNSTRTIALKEAIQYGVANLKLTIKADGDHLDDNASQKGGQVADQNIYVNGKLKMTGVLVGGQPSEVAWNYEPTSEAKFDRTVYDNKMNKSADDVDDEGIAVPVNGTSEKLVPNYTLVLDNKNNATGGSQANVVYVTVELVNGTDVDFYGVDGMVPKGGKFYLVGKLDMNTVSDTKKNGCDHIFVQDHTTVANFTIKDLRNAYNNIPDLRSTSVSVGLAVNLTWENGIEFNVEI